MKFVQRLTSSPFLLLLLALFLLDSAIHYCKPLRYVEMGGYVPADQNPLADKLESLRHEAAKSDILLVGSSLPMFAAVCSDFRAGEMSTPTIGYDACTYTKAKYFDGVLKEMLGKNLSVFNFCGNGCMASDSFIAIEQSIKNGMKPKVVILALAPRDFIDNFARPTEETAYFEFFREDKSPAHNHKPEDLFNQWASKNWSYYKLKPDYRTFFSLVASDVFHRAPTLYAATHQQPASAQVKFSSLGPTRWADITADEQKMQGDLRNYEMAYTPVNLDRFRAELKYFTKSLDLCRKHDILPVIVNMPRTVRNQAVLPVSFYAVYMKSLTAASKQYKCPFFDLNGEAIFVQSDFRDSVHLNGDGGLKVFNLLAAKLSKDENFIAVVEDKRQLSLK